MAASQLPVAPRLRRPGLKLARINRQFALELSLNAARWAAANGATALTQIKVPIQIVQATTVYAARTRVPLAPQSGHGQRRILDYLAGASDVGPLQSDTESIGSAIAYYSFTSNRKFLSTSASHSASLAAPRFTHSSSVLLLRH